MTVLPREWIEWTVEAVEILAVVIMLVFVVSGTLRWIVQSRHDMERSYRRYRITLGKALLLGLELLVAADIISTVTIDATLRGIALLGALVVVRTALSWTLTLEVDGRWPWQPEARDRR